MIDERFAKEVKIRNSNVMPLTKKLTGYIFLISCLMLLGCLFHCSTPDRPQGLQLGLKEVPQSKIVVDLQLPVKDLETGINRAIGRELMDGAIQLNARKDSLFLRITRTRNISLAFRNGLLYIAAPIKVSAVMKKKVLGMTISNEDQPVIFTATAQMSSNIDITTAWEAQFTCRWEALKWEVPPVLEIMGIRLDLTDVIESQIEDVKPIMEEKICLALNEKIALKPEVEKAYQKIQQPIELLKDAGPAYLSLNIQDLSASLGKYKTDTIVMRVAAGLEIKLTLETNKSSVKSLPARKDVSDHRTGINGYVELKLAYKDLDALAATHVTGQSFEYEGVSSTIGKVRFFQENGFLACEVNVLGDQNGKIVFFGIPSFDEALNFRMKHFRYELVEGDNLMTITDATLHSAFESYLEELIVFNLSEHVGSIGQMASQGIERTPLGQKIDLRLGLNQVRLHDLGMTDDDLQLIFQVDGDASILLQDQLFTN